MDNIISEAQIRKRIVVSVFLICIIPFVLNLMGFSFHSEITPLNLDKINQAGIVPDDLFYALKGGVEHALLEWSAVMVALFTVILSFAYYKITGDVTAPILGLALLASGIMDAFHTFAALRLIEAQAPNVDLIPFTWALSRSFNAVILIVGALLIMRFKKLKATMTPIICTGMVFVLMSYILIHLSATSAELPNTQFPDALITRPFDVFPLVVFLVTIPLFLKLYRQQQSLLVFAMLVGLIPEVILEMHMSFGSSHLFDNDFNIAHSLKILAYFIPFLGLLLDYIRSYKIQHKTQILLEQSKEELSKANTELEEFAYRTSHDLRAPLLSSIGLLGVASSSIEKNNTSTALKTISLSQKSLKKLDTLVSDILILTKVKNKIEKDEPINLKTTIDEILESFNHMDNFDKLDIQIDMRYSEDISTKKLQFNMILENLISNAIKYQDPEKEAPYIHILIRKDKGNLVIDVRDNGLGIPEEQRGKIFSMFERFHPKTSFGSGLGLYLIKKSADVIGAELSYEGLEDGSNFKLEVPIV